MKKTLVTLALVIGSAIFASAQKSEVFVKDGAAIHGYDPVAYFVAGRPVKGSKEFEVVYMGVSWHFSTRQNADAFKADPAKYAPQYGGYCAFGLADNHKAPTDPNAWTIIDGKLYLNYSKDVQARWDKKQKEYILAANKNWPLVKNKE